MPIVELEKDVWLAKWQGDPGRTLDIRSAKKFKTNKEAKLALLGARNYRPFVNAVIRPTPRALDLLSGVAESADLAQPANQ